MKPHLSFIRHALCLITAYLAALVISVPLTSSIIDAGVFSELSLISFAFATIASLPFLVTGLVVVFFARPHLERHTKKWCVITPLLITIAALVFERPGYPGAPTLLDYLSHKEAWLRLQLVFAYSSFAALFYYLLIKRALPKAQPSALDD